MAESTEEAQRIVLVGKTGVGKSGAGNTILRVKAFESKLSASSQTSECKKAKGEVDGRKVAVIDTPGLFDTKLTNDEIVQRIKMCISLSAPGPHVFLVVIQLGRFTEEEKETVRIIQTTFGEESAKYTMVLFTHGDALEEDETIEQFVSTSKDLKEIITKCNERYHVFNNKIKDPSQSIQLLDKIDRMAVANGGSYYTNEMFMKAEEAIEQEQARLLKQAEEQMQREMDILTDKYEGEDLERERTLVMKKSVDEARAQAERENGFTHHAIYGALVGASAGVGLGIYTGMQIGALGGAVAGPVGAMIGAAAGAVTGAAAGVTVGVINVAKECTIQ